jgi:hypothetical protein
MPKRKKESRKSTSSRKSTPRKKESAGPAPVEAYAIWNAGSDTIEYLWVGSERKPVQDHLERALAHHGEAEPDFRVAHIKEVKSR